MFSLNIYLLYCFNPLGIVYYRTCIYEENIGPTIDGGTGHNTFHSPNPKIGKLLFKGLIPTKPSTTRKPKMKRKYLPAAFIQIILLIIYYNLQKKLAYIQHTICWKLTWDTEFETMICRRKTVTYIILRVVKLKWPLL